MNSESLECTAPELARFLWETNSVTLARDKPFTFVSGLLSPIYTDCRRLISFPIVREKIVDAAVRALRQLTLIDGIASIAGGETAGIPYAAFLATRLGKPMVYVRKAPKDHGRKSLVEGVITQGTNVLLFEDLITDGGSKMTFINGLRAEGAQVTHCMVVFEYGLKYARAALKREKVELISLLDSLHLMEYGVEAGLATASDVDSVRAFVNQSDDSRFG